jgi:hypothetical protein
VGGDLKLRQITVQTIQANGRYIVRLAGSATDIAGVRSLHPLIVGDVAQALQVGPDLLIVGALETGWIYPTLINSWVNYDASGVFATARFRKAQGIVHVEGLVKDGTAPGVIFQLPAGFRPSSGATNGMHLRSVVGNNGFGRVDINPSGDVSYSVGTNAFVQLGTTFVAEQ